VDRPATAASHAAVRFVAGVLAIGLLTLGAPGSAAAASTVVPAEDPVPFDDMGPSEDPPLTGQRRGWPVHPTGPIDIEPGPPDASEKFPVLPALDLYRSWGFRYQDPNYAACTATSAMDMLNFIAIAKSGGTGFRWRVDLGPATRDAILAWERTHDTLAGGQGSDPHGWRNALNLFGWGSGALGASRVYDDFAFTTYDRAVKAAIRAIIRTHKPVGIVAWEGRHAQMLTGYDGLVGDPFARQGDAYSNTFTVANVRLSDPLKADGRLDSRIPYSALRTTSDRRIKYLPYREIDSPYDDPYTAGNVPARQEWYGRYILVLPTR
jgi:hypothetical protein